MYIPYVGITDFMNKEQVQKMLKVFNTHKSEEKEIQLHVGVMMSYRTFNGLPTKWENAFPKKEIISDIFFSEDVYNCLHYADYDTHDDNLAKTLCNVLYCSGFHTHALQLDMVWPPAEQIANGIHMSRKQIEVILQIGKNAFEEVDNKPEPMVEKLGEYDGIIQRVLLDKSMGKGIGMNALELLPFIEAIQKKFPEMGIGVAGGLGPETMSLAEPLIKKIPNLSIDAQGKLRSSGNSLDPIDWDLAEKYLIKALEIYR